MSAFHNVSFPLKLARGAVGGPSRTTEIFELGDGREARNTSFSASRRRWEVGSAIRSLDELAQITAFFEARRGKLHGFRFRDPADFKSCTPSAAITPLDQVIGVGDGNKTAFQLIKTYGDSAASYEREIFKPIPNSVRVAKAGVEVPASDFAVDTAQGIVNFVTAPVAGAQIRAGFSFDTPARFDTDHLDVALDAFDAGRVVSLSLVEIAL